MNKKRSIIYLTGGFIIFNSIFLSFVILPLFFKIINRANELITEKRNLNLSIERAQTPEGIDNPKLILNKVHDLYIDSRRPVDEIIFLERVALDNGLDININVVGPSDAGNWSYLTFVILIRGDSDGFIRFIETIQNAKWIAIINQLHVRRATERDMTKWEDSIVADVLINVYFRK